MGTILRSFWKATTVTLAVLCSNSQEANTAAVYTLTDTSNSTENSSSIGFDMSRGVSLNFAIDYGSSMTSKVTLHDGYESSNMDDMDNGVPDETGVRHPIDTGRGNHDKPPGRDSAPFGVTIYNSLDQVPSAQQMWRARKEQKCFSTGSGNGLRQCWAAYVCGHRCEPVLLAVNSYCRLEGPACSNGNGNDAEGIDEVKRVEGCENHGRWIRCQKPRKFRRCFARVCFRRRGLGGGGPRPSSYEDPLSIAIVRYIRPKPKHDLFMRRTRQHVESQSALF